WSRCSSIPGKSSPAMTCVGDCGGGGELLILSINSTPPPPGCGEECGSLPTTPPNSKQWPRTAIRSSPPSPSPPPQKQGARAPRPQRPVSAEEAPAWWRQRRYVLWLGAGLLASLGLVLGSIPSFRNRWWSQPPSAKISPIRIESLAVLPFENLSGDRSQDYFA